MHTGVIVVTNPGYVPADGYLEQALANNPSCVGFAVCKDGKMFINSMDKPDLAALKKVFTALKDVRVNMYLAKFPDGFMKDDIQPFVLIKDAEGKPVIACMLDGDWVTTASKDSSHSDEYHTAVSVLKPMFEQLWRLTKGDIKAIIEEIEGEATNNNLKNTFINRGSVHLIFNDSQVRTVVDNELEKEYDWGWTSNHYMYTEDKKEGDDPLAALL